MKDSGFFGIAILGIAAAIVGCESPGGTWSHELAGDAAVAPAAERVVERRQGARSAEGVMKGLVTDIEVLAVNNGEFRRVLYSSKHCQLVVMALQPKEEIGSEIRDVDQFFRVEEGAGEAVLDGVRTPIREGFAVLVPAGTTHNIVNTGSAPLKLYSLYAPQRHRDGVVHHTRGDSMDDKERFDGKTSE